MFALIEGVVKFKSASVL